MSQFFHTQLSNPTNEFDHLRFITVKSKALRRRADMTVYVPSSTQSVDTLDVVILLHGVYGSHWAWAMNAGVHKTAERLIQQGKMRPIVLVMPSDGLHGNGSGYLAHQTEDYEKWIVEEVVAVVKEQLARVNDDSEFFITGLSMGGYGALRLGAKYPGIFRSFSGLSSITEFAQMKIFLEKDEYDRLSSLVPRQEDVLGCMLANRETLSEFYFDCGTDDLLIEYNRKLHQDLKQNNIPHTYKENPGAHEWDYWKTYIEDSLLFFDRLKSKD